MAHSNQDINILLLGESGVGKSTFINAFANYIEFPEFKMAKMSEPICLIPTTFKIINEAKEEVIVKFGENDEDEFSYILEGEADTLACREYLFPVNNNVIKFIDTPGISDPKGIERDKFILENILSAIGDYEYLNGICILLKPNNAKLTPEFEFVITQLLLQLERNAANNIIFVYTNARGSNTPGDITNAIGKLLSTIEEKMQISIPHSINKNVFCFDYQTFRYLLAIKQNVTFNSRSKRGLVDCWEASVEECKKMLEYIIGGSNGPALQPHKTKNTLTIAHARNMIEALQKPIEDIEANIQRNIILLNNERRKFSNFEGDVQELAKQYSIPIIELVTSSVPESHIACTSQKCRKIILLADGISYVIYPQQCVTGLLSNAFVRGLRSFTPISLAYFNSNFNWNASCKSCGCALRDHIAQDFKTEIVKRTDNILKAKLDRVTNLKDEQKIILEESEMRLKNIRNEQSIIIENNAKFAYFPNKNSILAYNDSFDNYLQQAIKNEETKAASLEKDEQILRYKRMLRIMRVLKRILQNLLMRVLLMKRLPQILVLN